MTAISQALSMFNHCVAGALLHFVWQGLLAAFLLWIALWVLQKRSANLRYLASCLALAAMPVAFATTAFLLYRPADSALRIPTGSPLPIALGTATVATTLTWIRWLEWEALPLWSLGVFLFSMRLLWGCRQVAMLRRSGETPDGTVRATISGLARRVGLTRPIGVLISRTADGPSVTGWLRPVILLPASTMLGLTPQQLEAVLAHELAHIRRHDYLVNMLQNIIETLLFYHPAVWWMSARIRHERELCCDDLAVRSCGDALCYARALTTLERLRLTTPRLALGTTDGPLLYRIQRLIGTTTHEYSPSKWPGILALCMGLACFALNVNWAHAQAPETRTAGPVDRGVQVDLGGASVMHRAPVVYPERARKSGVQGTVAVEVALDATGSVSDARVLSGPPELRKAALQSVLQWHFTRDVAGSTPQVNITFQLPAPGEPEQFTMDGQVYVVSRSADNAKRESQMREIQAKVSAIRNQPETAQSQKELAEFNEMLVDMKRGIENARRELPVMEGRTLARIDVRGISPGMRDQLIALLPVHLGDTVSKQSMEAAAKAVRRFDEHFASRIVPTEDGQAALLILAPNSEGR